MTPAYFQERSRYLESSMPVQAGTNCSLSGYALAQIDFLRGNWNLRDLTGMYEEIGFAA